MNLFAPRYICVYCRSLAHTFVVTPRIHVTCKIYFNTTLDLTHPTNTHFTIISAEHIMTRVVFGCKVLR